MSSADVLNLQIGAAVGRRWIVRATVLITVLSTVLIAFMPVGIPKGPIDLPIAYFLPAAVVSVALIVVSVLLGYRATTRGDLVPGALEDAANGFAAPYADGDSEDAALIRREQMRHVLTQLYLMMGLNIANAAFMVTTLVDAVSPWLLGGWFAAILLLSLVAVHARYRGRHRPLDRETSKRTIRRVTMHSGVRGFIWGLAIALFFADARATEQLILASIAAGMLSGGTLALAPIPSAALAYGGGMMIPAIIRFAAMGTLEHFVLAGFVLTFCGCLSLICAHFYSNFAGQLIARRAATEQAATISLLLNDYEDKASDWLWECDRNGFLTRVPPRMRELLGIPQDAELPIDSEIALHSVAPSEIADLTFKMTTKPRVPFRGVLITCTSLNGIRSWIELSATPKPGGGWRGVGSDRTKEIMARQETVVALERTAHAEMRLKDGIDSLASGLVLTGSDDHVIIANRRFGELFPVAGLMGSEAAFEAIIAAQATAWFHGSPDRGAEWITHLLAHRRNGQGAHDLELPDGRWLRVDARTTSEGGVVTVFTEITDIKHQEARLANQSQALERSNGELARFAYSASHDLQEPLRKVEAFGSRLKSRAVGQLDTDSIMFIDRMTTATARMRRLISDLLEFSRVSRMSIDAKQVDLTEIVSQVIDDLSVSIEERNARVICRDLGIVHGDETLLRRLIQNLITNALKFHKPGVAPEIIVSLKNRADGSSEITVADNGIGFNMKHHDRIFEAFQRLHGRNEFEGSGIGLATCVRIAAHHGGTIHAESAPGEGAKFFVTLAKLAPKLSDVA